MLSLQGGIKLSQQALACVGHSSLAALPNVLFSLVLLCVSSFWQCTVISVLCLSSLCILGLGLGYSPEMAWLSALTES